MKALVLALALAAPGLVPAAEPSPSEKSPPSARVHGSAFADYRPLIDEPMRPWRDANDEMGRLGGHIGHIGRIGNEADTPARPAPASAGTPPRTGPGNADTVSPGAHPGHQR
jgi:hypothetical protein